MMTYWNQILPEALENPLKPPIPRPYPVKPVPPFLDPAYHEKYEGRKHGNSGNSGGNNGGNTWGTVEKEPPIPVYKFEGSSIDGTDAPAPFNNFDPFSNFPFRPMVQNRNNRKDEAPVYGKVVHEDTRNANNDIMDRPDGSGTDGDPGSVFGVGSGPLLDKEQESVVQSADFTSSLTASAVLIGCICFLLLNTLCFVAICVQKSKLKVRERLFNNRFRCTGNRSDDYDVDDRYVYLHFTSNNKSMGALFSSRTGRHVRF